jgi:hypothetical protein
MQNLEELNSKAEKDAKKYFLGDFEEYENEFRPKL